jgi:hypothetical protein
MASGLCAVRNEPARLYTLEKLKELHSNAGLKPAATNSASLPIFAFQCFQQDGPVRFWVCFGFVFSTHTCFQQLPGFVFGFVWVCFWWPILCYQ